MSLLDMRSLAVWLDLLENRHAQEIQLGLTRVRDVANKLGLLEWEPVVISVAGTNGKGSTVRALECIYMAAGLNVASYTSPHIFSFCERICINQKPIDEDMLCMAFHVIEETRKTTYLTYFETATLAALWYFRQHSLDVIILEVGMGGRLDATNIIDSDLTVITSIDFDHQAYLGNTLDAIAFEKAGIMRENKPCIYADHHPPAAIKKTACERKTPLYVLGEDYCYSEIKSTNYSQNDQGCAAQSLLIRFRTDEWMIPVPNLYTHSAVAAIVASQLLQDVLPVGHHAITNAMTTARIMGRKQWVMTPVPTLYDVAHNPQAVRSLEQCLKSLKPQGRVLAVFSALADKDLMGLIAPIKPYIDAWYPALLPVKRAANESLLTQVFLQQEQHVHKIYPSPKAAYEAALMDAGVQDLIVVYGSFYLIGGIMNQQGECI